MLDEDSEVSAVAFQLHGTKGWDDVGVRLSNGTTRLFQMKHSRVGDSLTFGDLIASEPDDTGSLLRSLATAWKAERSARGKVECVLVTNRRAGPNWYDGSPPLAEFFSKVQVKVSGLKTIDEVCWTGDDKRYPDAWQKFLVQLSDLGPEEQLAFLLALTLETSSPDLIDLESKLLERLAALTGLPTRLLYPLFNALHANLRKWSCFTVRESEWIDRESLRAILAREDSPPLWLGHCEVETPDPFFPSRLSVVETLHLSLLADSPHKVDFLSAEPGAGKTSCTSKLARSSSVLWKEQCVSVRFYAYRPIRPGVHDIESDVSAVDPEALWLGLLWQIRENLRKTQLLSELRVPVWLDGMPWEIARSHVLRLAEILGNRWARPFVICIDGIDHAARAGRKRLPQFLDTLPSPEAIPPTVRFLLAGQPAESYPEYPFFLRQPHAAVNVHSLENLSDEDILLLWRSATPRIAKQFEPIVLRLLAETTNRRTLPVVYAVEDIRDSKTIEEATETLNSRPLSDSLNSYYDTIWSGAIVEGGDSYRLAAAFALLRERPTAELLSSAFSELGKSVPAWKDILRALRPLVRDTPQGFELVHNDLRVHLEARLAGDAEARRDAASMLADHYRTSTCNRLAAHHSLLSLLATAERTADFCDDFTVDWVIEAGSLDAMEGLAIECAAAFRAAIARKDWLLLHSVGCAALTFQRLQECVNTWAGDADPLASFAAPSFLSVEGEPVPVELWSAEDFFELNSACFQLVESGATRRAALVLKQWVGGVHIQTLIATIVSATQREDHDNRNLQAEFERLGRLHVICDLPLAPLDEEQKEHLGYLQAIESGWADEISKLNNRRSALRQWILRRPYFLGSWTKAIKGAAASDRWGEVRALLDRIYHCKDNLDRHDQFLLGWYAARSKPRTLPQWSEVFSTPNYGFSDNKATLGTIRVISQWLSYTDPVREPAQIADDLLPILDLRASSSKDQRAVRLLIRASAIIGRILRYLDNDDLSGVEISVPPTSLEPYLRALWCITPDWKNLPLEEFQTPREIGTMLAELAWRSGHLYRELIRCIGLERFPEVMLHREGLSVFDVLLQAGERDFLKHAFTERSEEIISKIHEVEYSSRNSILANLLYYSDRLGTSDIGTQLAIRFRVARIGYGSHKEWVFEPLVRWFEILRKRNPSSWKSQGNQLLELDRIAELQRADNQYNSELIAEIGAAAMESSPDDFEALFTFIAHRDSPNALADLAIAARDGFRIRLRDGNPMDETSTLALVAVAIALGRWPMQSALSTVTEFLAESPILSQQTVWRRALSIAAEIQSVPIPAEPTKSVQKHVAPQESRNAEAILAGILSTSDSSYGLLKEIAALAEKANAENRVDRDSMVDAAIGVVESTGKFGRYVEYHGIELMSQLYRNLTPLELWRLLGAITAITENNPSEPLERDWVLTTAFSAATLSCRAKAENSDDDFVTAVVEQLLDMHWKWNGLPRSSESLHSPRASSTWTDAARRMLLSLTRTEGCEPLYMAMSGVRFFSEAFPDEIDSLCRDGLAERASAEAIISVALLWATRNPGKLTHSLAHFRALQECGPLEERLDSWLVSALSQLASNRRPSPFVIPAKVSAPEIAFRGDEQLLETEVSRNGLNRHNSFFQTSNEKLRRVAIILGPMESAFRHMAKTIRQSNDSAPTFELQSAKLLASNEHYPRPSRVMENLVGDSILHQCAGEEWHPSRAAAVRLALGSGMEPWIASATPNPWPEDTKASWPSDYELERWIGDGSPPDSEVALKMVSLLHGEDLPSDCIQLGAYLRIPTFRRDLQFRFWLAQPEFQERGRRAYASTPAGRTLASWLPGWSFASNRSNGGSVQFAGTLVDYPNSELDITPTNQWINEWEWLPNPSNALQFLTAQGLLAAWHERWLGPYSHSRRIYRQPLLSRWIAKRSRIPEILREFNDWTVSATYEEALLEQPE